MELVGMDYGSFCPVYADPSDEISLSGFIDTCKLPDKNINKTDLNLLIPEIPFDDKKFLKFYYDISSFAEAIEWATANIVNPYNNIRRVIDSAWRSYGDEANVIDYPLIDIYLHFAKTKWYRLLHKTIIKTLTPKQKKKHMKTKDEIMEMIDKNFVQSIISKFYTENKKQLSNMPSASDIIKKIMTNSLEKIRKI